MTEQTESLAFAEIPRQLLQFEELCNFHRVVFLGEMS